MARRRRRAPRRRRQSKGRRWVRWLVIAVVVAVPLLYFAFSILFYDPREPETAPFPELVPRDVDVYLRREGLAHDINTLPKPRLLEQLQRTREWRDMASTTWWKGLEWPGELGAGADELTALAADLPFDLLEDVLGREVVVLGRYGEGEAATRQSTALMARITSDAKLAIEALDIELLLQRALPGAVVTELEDPEVPAAQWRRFERPDAEPVFFSRHNDLFVLSADETFLRDVLLAVHGDPERSLGKSRHYLEGLPAPLPGLRDDPEAADFSAEVVLDLPSWFEHRRALEAAGPTPGDGDLAAAGSDPGRSPDFLANLARILFDPYTFKESAARFDVADGDTSIRAHVELAPWAGAEPHGLRDTPSFDVPQRLSEMFGLLPSDVTAAVTMNVELRPFLRALVASLDPEVSKLINSTIRDLARDWPAWQVQSLDGLVSYLDRTLGSEITIAVRPLDHEVPEGSQPLPLMAIMVPLRNPQLWEELALAVIMGYRTLGIDPDTMLQQDEGVGTRKWLGLTGLPVDEISFIALDWKAGTHMLVVATDDDFLREIVTTYTSIQSGSLMGSGRPALTSLKGMRRWIGELQPDGTVEPDKRGQLHGVRSNVALWADSDAMREMFESYGEYVADTETLVDLGVLRIEERRKLIRQLYPQYAPEGAGMPDELSRQLDTRLDGIINGLEDRRLNEQVPALAKAWRDGFAWLDLVRSGVATLNYRSTDADLDVRIETVLAPARGR